MPGTFSRLKVWIKERLLYSELNSEFNNIINNMTPSGVDDASADVTAMRAEADPIPSGVESLATSLLGELQRMRSVLRRMQGGTYWYSDIGTILTANPKNLLAYAPSDGNTTTEALVDYLQRHGLLNALSMSAANIVVGDFDGTNKKFGNYAMKVNTTAIFALMAKASQSFSLSTHFRNLAAGDYIAYNPGLGIEVYLDASGFLTVRAREQGAASETAKVFSTVAGSISRAANTSFQHVIVRTRLNAVGGATTDLLHLLRDGADEGTQLNGASIPIGVGACGPWFLGARPNDPTWTKFSAMLVNPDVEASSPWTLTLGTAARAVAAGILTMTLDALESIYFSRTTGVDLANMTIDTKVRVTGSPLNFTAILADVYDTSMGRGMTVTLEAGRLNVNSGLVGGRVVKSVPLDTSQWNHIRITSLGSPSPVVRIYVNGVQVMVFANNQVLAPGADLLQFGALGSTVDTYTVEMEHYAYISSVAATVYPPIQVAAAATGQIDDFALLDEQLSSILVTALGANSAASVYRLDNKPGLYIPPTDFGFLLGADETDDVPQLEIWLASDGRTELDIQMLAQLATVVTPAYLYDLRLLQSTATESLILQSISTQYIASGFFNATCLGAKRIFPLGVHRLAASLASFNGADTISGRINLSVQKGREI